MLLRLTRPNGSKLHVPAENVDFVEEVVFQTNGGSSKASGTRLTLKSGNTLVASENLTDVSKLCWLGEV